MAHHHMYIQPYIWKTLSPTKSQTRVLYPHFDTQLGFSGDAVHQHTPHRDWPSSDGPFLGWRRLCFSIGSSFSLTTLRCCTSINCFLFIVHPLLELRLPVFRCWLLG